MISIVQCSPPGKGTDVTGQEGQDGREIVSEVRTPSYCAQCRSRCGCVAIVEDGRLKGIEPMPEHPSGKALCPKGHASAELVHHPDRLTYPLRRVSPKGTPPEWKPVTWDEALDEIAGRMADIRAQHGAEQTAFSVTTGSGTHISDAISWIERFIRAYGSPNTIYSTEICNWHKDFASRFTYGSDIGTPDFANTDCALIWGHNPATTWLSRSTEIREARGRGMKTIIVEPRRTLYAKRADVWLRVKPGTDQALALGLIRLILDETGFDEDFTSRWTNARALVRRDNGRVVPEITADGLFEEQLLDLPDGPVACATALKLLQEAVAEWTPERVERVTSVPEERLRAAATLLSESASVAYYCWNGVGQSTTATQTDRAISILYSLLGHYGAKGGNVPGGAAAFNSIAGHDLLPEEQLNKALGLAERPLGPGRQGWITARDAYRAIVDGDPYPLRMLFSFGGNLLSAQPDTSLAREALQKLDFHVHADFFMNPTAEHADIVLPVSTSWERDALRTGFDVSLEGQRRVQLRQAVVNPSGEARSDTDIVFGLADRLGLSEMMFDGDLDKGRTHILARSGVNLEDLKKTPEGIDVVGTVPFKPYLTYGFPTPSGLINIYSEMFLDFGQNPLPSLEPEAFEATMDTDYPIRLGSAKTVAYCHSQGRNIPALRKLTPDPIAELSPELAGEKNVKAGDWIEISTRSGAFRARAKLVEDHVADAVFAQHGWTGGEAGMSHNMNVAVPTDLADPISGSIPLRWTWCDIQKVDGPF
jgi:anaerobic selenocysteine-containing dehydrogenase